MPRSSTPRKRVAAADEGASLSVALRELLHQEHLRRQLEPGETLYRTGGEATQCYVIELGSLLTRAHGRRGAQWRTLVGPGELLGAVDLMLGRPYSRDAEAAERTVVHVIPRDLLLAQLEGTGVLMHGIIQALARNLDRLSPGGRS